MIGVPLGHSGGIGSYRTLLYTCQSKTYPLLCYPICFDFDKIEDELKKIEESLKFIVSDEKKCTWVIQRKALLFSISQSS